MLCSPLAVLWVMCVQAVGSRYAFFRKLEQQDARRVFGGREESADAWPAACALLDHALMPRCSCAVLAPRWALTAAHCAVPDVAYVQYTSDQRDVKTSIVHVRLVYSHPQFKAELKDLGTGPDVVTLHNDIGLVRTRADMKLPDNAYSFSRTSAVQDYRDLVAMFSAYKVEEILGKEINVLGFGMTEKQSAGEQLRSARLRLVACQRDGWPNCACALGLATGVCSGDSGGPVLYNGTQIGVTSMGPVECGSADMPPQMAMSVFTELRPYAQHINDTMHDLDAALRMKDLARGADVRSGAGACAGFLLTTQMLLRCF